MYTGQQRLKTLRSQVLPGLRARYLVKKQREVEAGSQEPDAATPSTRFDFVQGKEDGIAVFEIRWPSGTLQVHESVAGDQILKITEPLRWGS